MRLSCWKDEETIQRDASFRSRWLAAASSDAVIPAPAHLAEDGMVPQVGRESDEAQALFRRQFPVGADDGLPHGGVVQPDVEADDEDQHADVRIAHQRVEGVDPAAEEQRRGVRKADRLAGCRLRASGGSTSRSGS